MHVHLTKHIWTINNTYGSLYEYDLLTCSNFETHIYIKSKIAYLVMGPKYGSGVDESDVFGNLTFENILPATERIFQKLKSMTSSFPKWNHIFIVCTLGSRSAIISCSPLTSASGSILPEVSIHLKGFDQFPKHINKGTFWKLNV